MNFNGKPKGIYEFKKNKEVLATGTIEEICKEVGLTYNALHMKVYRTKTGANTKTKYYLKQLKDSVHTYLLVIDDNLIGEGTLKELSEKSNYSREHLGKIVSGNFKNKDEKIKLYKRVG